MGTEAKFANEIQTIVDAALRGVLTREQALHAHGMGSEFNAAVLMAINVWCAQHAAAAAAGAPASGAHTPSGAIPPYAKPPASRSRRKRPGGKVGHVGHRRAAPAALDRVEQVDELTACPECSGPVKPARRRRRRVIEDIPQGLALEAVGLDIPQHWCPCCRKHVEPRVAAALPNATIGNGLVALSTVFHYGLGLTIDQVREVVSSHLQSRISAGGLVDLWQRVAAIFLPWYERIAADARCSATLHADETSWRVDGLTHWLWCFCNHDNCWYMIDQSRGSEAMKRFFVEAFRGVLIHDFWAPYDSVLLEGNGEHQCCLAHLLRELDEVDLRQLSGKSPDAARDWIGFAKMLRRLIRDGIRLRRRANFAPQLHAGLIQRIDRRLVALAEAAYVDSDASRLAKRLSRHKDSLFTFLDRPEADWQNNFAERQIRPAVILRKNSQCNRSELGAATQAVLMSVYRTLKLRGHDPRTAIEAALRSYCATGTLPELPTRVPAKAMAVVGG
jgi:transposase